MSWLTPLARWQKPNNRKSRRAKRPQNHKPKLEQLENREVFSANLATVGAWTPQGPGPIQFGVVEGMESQNNPFAGSVQDVAVAPDGQTAYAATTGGGIWKTSDVTAANPTWTPLTDDLPSLAMTDVDLHPANSSIVVAGTSDNGVYRSTDGGTTWAVSNAGASIVAVALSKDDVRGAPAQLFIGAAVGAGENRPGGLFESLDGGITWNKSADVTGVLPTSVAPSDLIEVSSFLDTVPNPDVLHPRVFFAAFPGVGVFQSNDFATWAPIAPDELELADNKLIKLAAGRSSGSAVSPTLSLYAGLINSEGELSDVQRNQFNSFQWASVGIPTSMEDLLDASGNPGHDGVSETTVGLHSFGRGLQSFSIMVDPRNPAFVYVGGDTQPLRSSLGVLPEAITSEFSGRLFRLSGSWNPIVGISAGQTSPHADSRSLVFVDHPTASDFILEADAGGLYKLTDPGQSSNLASGIRWTSVNGNLQIADISSVAFDRTHKVYTAGTRKDGTIDQATSNSSTWQTGVLSTFNNDPFQAERIQSGFRDSTLVTVNPLNGRSVRLSTSFDLTDAFRREFGSDGKQVDINATILTSTDHIAEALFRSGLEGGDLDERSSLRYPMVLNAADGTRIAVGGRNLYESTNIGRTLRTIGDPTGLLTGRFFTALAAGTPTNAQVLYAAYGNLIAVRDAGSSNPGAPIDRVFRIDGETDILDLVIDPQNSRTAYAVTARNIYKILDGGIGNSQPRFQLLTGNLESLSRAFRTLELVITGSGPLLLVGGQGGVFLTSDVNAVGPKWEEIGTGLPNAVVNDLHFDAQANLLYVGTDGRGVWQITNPDFVGNRGILTINGTTGNDTTTLSLTPDGSRIRVVQTDGTNKLFPFANIGEIRISSAGGNDTVTIDGINGFPGRSSRSNAPLITINDTSGTDTLTFTNVGSDIAIEKTGTNFRILSADGTTTPITITGVESLPAAVSNPLAVLGHGIEQFLREANALRVTPHVSAEVSNLGLLTALDGNSNVIRRIFEQSGLNFSELGTTIADIESLEQKLQSASSFGTHGASVVQDSNGLRMNFRTLAGLTGQGRIHAGQEQGFANVDLIADLKAAVALDLQFGVDAQGRFFIGTSASASPEIVISNLGGTVSGEARLGFLGVTIKNGTIASDPTANFEINFFDPGTIANDNKLLLDEFDKFSSANVNAVLLPGTKADVPNLTIDTTIDVSLFKFSVFENANVRFTWNDFNSPANFSVTPTLGPDSTAQQLIDFITVNAGQIVAAIQNLSTSLESVTGTQLLDTEIPVLGKSLAEVLNAVAQPYDLPADSIVGTTITNGLFQVGLENLDMGAAGIAIGRTITYRVGNTDQTGVVEAVDTSSFTVRPNITGQLPASDSTVYRILRPGTIAEQFNSFFGDLDFTVPTLQDLIRDLGSKLGIDLISKVTVEGTGVNRFLRIPIDFSPDPFTFSQNLDFAGSIPLLELQTNSAFNVTVAPEFHIALGISLAKEVALTDRFFIVNDVTNELQFDVSAQLTPNATGRIGFLDISLGAQTGRSGQVNLQSIFGVNIVDPNTPTDPRITLAELATNGLDPFSVDASGKLNIDGLAIRAGISESGDLGEITVSLDGNDAQQGLITSIEDLTELPGRLLANTKGTDNFLQFSNITGLDIAAALIELIQELSTLSKAPVFTNALPLINKSPAELLTLAESLISSLNTTPDDLDTPDTASTFSSADKVRQFLESKLGTPVGLAVDSQAVRFIFDFDSSKSKSLPFSFALGSNGSFANVSAAGNLTAIADAGMTVTLGIVTASKDATGKTIALTDRVFLDVDGTDATTFDVSVNLNSGYTIDGATPNPLQFIAAVGPIDISIVNGRALLRGGFTGALRDLPGSTDGKLTLGEIKTAAATGQLGSLFGIGLTGDVQALLPIDGNNDKTVTIPPGSADALVQIAGKIENFSKLDFSTTITPAAQPNIPIANSSLNANSVLVNVTNLDGLVANGLLSFSNLVEGFEDLLAWGQKIFGVNVLDAKLPLIGKSIRDGLNFLEGQSGSIADVLANMRNTINSSAAPTTNAAVSILAGAIADNLRKLPNVVALGDVDKNGTVNSTTSGDFFRVETDAGKVTGVTFFLRYQPTITINSPFNLGLDFLPLSANGAVGASVALDAYLGFGVDFTSGFFVKTDFTDVPLTSWKSTTPEISTKVSVFANQDLTISIGGLSFEADFNPNTGTVTGTLNLNLNGGADGRITGNELIQAVTGDPQQFVTLDFLVGAKVDVPLKLAAGSELPSLEARLFFDVGNGGQVNLTAGESLNPSVALNDVKINAGSFIDRIAKPLLEKLEIFSPFAKFVNTFTEPLPLLDRSIYDVLREQLVKNGNTGAVNTLDFLVKIGNFVDSASSMAAQAGGLFIDFGDIPLVGGMSAGGTVSSIVPGVNKPSSVSGAPVAVADVVNPDATGTAAGSKADVAGIPGSGLPIIGNFLKDLGELGITFPVLKIGNVVKLATGQTVDIVFVNLPELSIDVDFNSPNIPLFNFGIPYVADVNIAASFSVDFGLKVNLSAGLDTRGLNSPSKSFLNGFYIGDFAPGSNGQIDPTDAERPEVVLSAALGIDVNAAVRLLGLEAGSITGHGSITGVLEVDINDDNENNYPENPNDHDVPAADTRSPQQRKDGKLYLDEIGIIRDSRAGSVLALFDFNGKILAELGVTLRALGGLFEKSYDFDFVIYEFENILRPEPPLNDTPDLAFIGPRLVSGATRNTLVLTRTGGTSSSDRALFAASNNEGGDQVQILLVDKNNNPNDGYDIATLQPGSYTVATTSTTTIVPIPGTNPIQVTSQTTHRHTVTQQGVDFAAQGVKVGQRVRFFSTIPTLSGETERFATITAVNGNSFTFSPGILGATFDTTKPVSVLSGRETIRVKKGTTIEDFGPGEIGGNFVSDINQIQAIVVDGGSITSIGSFGNGDDELLIDPFFRGIAHILGGAGNDLLIGGSGNDILDGGDGNDSIVGNAGNDLLIGGRGDDEIDGGEGNDTLVGDRRFASGTSVVADGEGRDVISGGAGNDRIFGDNTLRSTGANVGLEAHDIISGGLGDDHITAGEGNDIVFGNEGDDRIEGEDGADQLHGDDGNDTIYSGTGNDDIRGGLGNDQLFTGDVVFTDRNGGIDHVRGNNETGIFVLNFNPSIGIDDDLVNGLDSEFFYYHGGDGHDTILGSAKSDLIFGAAGGNDIVGGGGFDKIIGSSKNDRIIADIGQIDGLALPQDYLDSLPPIGTGGDFIAGSGGTDVIQNFSGDIVGNQVVGANTNTNTPGTLDFTGATAGLNFNLDLSAPQSIEFANRVGSIVNGGIIDNVIGSTLADNFTLQVGSRPRTIDGGLQSIDTLDRATVNVLGANVTIRSNRIEATGFQPITLDNIEAFSLMNAGSAVTVVGTAGDDILRLFVSGSTLRYELNGVEVNMGTITQFIFSSGGGNDRLILDFAGGNPIPVGGITFSGGYRGTTNDVLELRGTGIEVAQHTISNSPTGGTILISGRTITASTVSHVEASSFARYTLSFENDFGPVDIVTGGRESLAIQSEVLVSGRPVTVTHATLTNIPTVTLEVGLNSSRAFDARIDSTVHIAAKAVPAGTTLMVQSGQGSDSLIVEPGAGSIVWDAGTGADTFHATGDVNYTLQDDRVTVGPAATVVLAGAAVENFALTGGASANSFTLNNFSKTVTLDGAAGTDSVSINLTGGSVSAVDPLTLTGNIITNASATTARIEGLYVATGSRIISVANGTANSDLIIDAAITGNGSFTHSGTGTRVLDGTPSSTGANTLASGTLSLNSVTTPGTFIQTGGILAGNGTIGRYAGSGGTIQPGTSTTAGGLSLEGSLQASSSNTFAFSLHGTSAARTHDAISVRGSIDLGGAALNASLSGFTSAVGNTYTIIDNDGTDAIIGTFANLPERSSLTIGANTFTISYRGGTGNDVVLTHTNTASAFAQRTISSAAAGELVELHGVPVDADALDDFRLTVNWGDGSEPESFVFPPQTPEVNLNHRYARPGRYTVSLQWVDQHGGGRSDQLIAFVTRPAAGPQASTFTEPFVLGNQEIVVRNRDGSERFRLPAFDAQFTGEVAIALGDVTGDGVDDVVLASGNGGGPRVLIIDGQTQQPVVDFFAYEGAFRGGVFVTLGNMDSDPELELVTGTGIGGGPRVRAFDFRNGTPEPIADYFAYADAFRGGVTVAVADLDQDGIGEIITGTGPGGGPHVRTFDAQGTPRSEFFAFDTAFRGGVSVGAFGETLAVGTGPGGGPIVQLYQGAVQRTLLVGNPEDRGGVRVGVADIAGDAEADLIITLSDRSTKFRSIKGEEIPFEEMA